MPILTEFVLTPGVFGLAALAAERANLVVLQEVLKGIADDGILADLELGQLMTQVRDDELPKLPQAAKTRIETLLNLLRDRRRLTMRPTTGRTPSSESEWLTAAIESHGCSPLDAVVITSTGEVAVDRTSPKLLELPDVLDSGLWESARETDVRIKRRRGDFAAALPPLLRYAKWVMLVDPYFRVTPRNGSPSPFVPTLEVVSGCLGKCRPNRAGGRVLIHAAMEKQGSADVDHYREWSRRLEALARLNGHTYLVYLNPVAGFLHDRFIVTDQCAVESSNSLESFTGPQVGELTLSRKSAARHRELCRDYRFTEFARATPWLEVSTSGTKMRGA